MVVLRVMVLVKVMARVRVRVRVMAGLYGRASVRIR